MSVESDMEYSDNDGDEEDYYHGQDYDMKNVDDGRQPDPEYFPYSCLKVEEVEKMLNESIKVLCNNLKVTLSVAKIILRENDWNEQVIIMKYKENPSEVLIHSKVKCAVLASPVNNDNGDMACTICTKITPMSECSALACGHLFCNDCWMMHFEVEISQGVSITMQCMAQECQVRAPEDFVISHINNTKLRDRFRHFMFQDYVNTHPQLRFCPSTDCQWIFRAYSNNGPRRVVCCGCEKVYCFSCGANHHAPADCQTIKLWLIKCADDSETANYINANTKGCPKCKTNIERSDGCNHLQCRSCFYEFCWVCLGNWKTHGPDYFQCNRSMEDPNMNNNSQQAQASEALKKYLHYYQRWYKHAQSVKLEEQTLDGIKTRINSKIMAGEGTWIDWQYLWEAARLLKRCHYTLQYTYPCAYYMEGPKKDLFEYQQAQLEVEIEKLSSKIENVESGDRGYILNQMDIAEKKRLTILKACYDALE